MSNQIPNNQTKKKRASKQTSTPSLTDDAIEKLMAVIRPLTEFHETINEASDADLRIYWDVRVVKGGDKPFASTTGSSSLPSILAKNMKMKAPALIQQEVMDKIATPLVAVMQREVEGPSSGDLLKLADTSMVHDTSPDDAAIRIAEQHEVRDES